ncbi:hypothetical protein CBW46_018275 [Paenibacillus xerothermodurans]|uniref:Uncharacterized protein n=1 Tax=Paenibacillus xerothermodurans TaxID=1977292 RepID=A0A2W1N6R1_PAEXE|nr:hypothetical protein CBW46_018275 [Paenibacillus xerothermodurans]
MAPDSARSDRAKVVEFAARPQVFSNKVAMGVSEYNTHISVRFQNRAELFGTDQPVHAARRFSAYGAVDG